MEVLASQARQRKYCSHECYLGTRAGRPRRKWAKIETRACLVCGKTFEVGGAGRPPRRQRLCSDACQRKSRYRTGSQAKVIAERDAIYLAAFVDGEGSIMLGARGDTASVILSASNTKRNVLDWMVEATGVGRVQHHRPGTEKHAEAFFWRCTGDAAESVLRQIAAHLKLKRPQAELAIAFQERLRDPAQKADRAWQYEAMARLRALNRRGPGG